MKIVLEYIKKRSDDHRRHPFIQWLDDESIPVKQRLSLWYPYSSYFIMSFNDLSGLIFPYSEKEIALDERKKLITEHCRDDATHKGLFFRDLQALGLDKEMKFSEFLDFMWGEEELDSRLFVYRICSLVDQAENPLLRYCMLACIEFHVQVLFGKLVELSKKYYKESGIKLEFMGERHMSDEIECIYDLENGDAKDVSLFTNEKLDDISRQTALNIAQYMCDQIALSRTNMLKFARKSQLTKVA